MSYLFESSGVRIGNSTLEDLTLSEPGSGGWQCALECDLSQLVNVLCGLIPPDAGLILCCGQSPSTLLRAGRISVLTEEGILLSNLRVWENAVLPAAYHRHKSCDALLDAMDTLFKEPIPKASGLMDVLAKMPHELSPVQRQMISLMGAVLLEPHLLVVTGIFSGLNEAESEGLSRFALWAQEKLPHAVWLWILRQSPLPKGLGPATLGYFQAT